MASGLGLFFLPDLADFQLCYVLFYFGLVSVRGSVLVSVSVSVQEHNPELVVAWILSRLLQYHLGDIIYMTLLGRSGLFEWNSG